MIKLDLKEKKFGDKIVLKNIEISINNGEIVQIEGKSGIGKTTLIRILSQLENSFDGKIENDFKTMSITFPERVFLGGIDLFSEIKILTNENDDKIYSALNELALSNSAKKRAKELSTGMRSRASVIRAMLAKSEIVFLDEPLLGLDENTKILVNNFINNNLNSRTLIYTGEDMYFEKLTQKKIILK